jgi:isoleucyl-tRNA synthetase
MVLSEVTKLIAPFAPFIAEYMYRDLIGGESVFLDSWADIKVKDDAKLEKQMELAKEIVEQVNAARDEAQIKLRWPVEEIMVSSEEDLDAVEPIIAQMSNSKKILFSDKAPKNAVTKEFSAGKVMLSKDRSPEIVNEGLIRDLMRHIQSMRKKEKLDVSEYVDLKIATTEEFAETVESFRDEIASNTTSKNVQVSVGKPKSFKAEAKIEGNEIWLDYNK